MTTNQDETDGVQGFLMELLYTSLGREKPCWYHPEPEELRQAIDREVVRITILWQRFAFVTVNVSVYTGYVRRQQMVLLHCLDWLDSIGEEREDIRVGKAAIQQLLDFLLEHFEDALQKRLIIPAFQQARIVAQLKMDLPHLQKRLNEGNIQMTNLIVDEFAFFIEGAPDSNYFYGQVLMMRNLMRYLTDSKVSSTRIFQQLIFLNCNGKRIYKYCKRLFLKPHLTLFEKAYFYRRLAKFFKRQPVKKGSFLEADTPRLTLQMADYFADLALDSERQLQLHENTRATISHERLALQLTIEQLGLYVRLFKQVGVVKPVPNAQVIRFCMKYLRTAGKASDDEISYEYLKSSIARHQEGAYNVVEKQLNEMLVELRRMRIEARKSS
jgi:hypothetical protein